MTSELLTSITSSLTLIKSDALTLLALAIPIAFAIWGIILVVRIAKRGIGVVLGR